MSLQVAFTLAVAIIVGFAVITTIIACKHAGKPLTLKDFLQIFQKKDFWAGTLKAKPRSRQ